MLIAAATLAVATPAAALDPERAVGQYLRDTWGREQGFPGGQIYGLAQTADGYLWIAAEKGLVRFDGVTFRLFEPIGLPETGPAILDVAASPDGSVWARPKGPALVRFRHGGFEDILPVVGLTTTVVTAMFRGRGDAMVLATLGQGAVAYRNGVPARIGLAGGALTSSFIISGAEARGGDIWFGTRDAGLLRIGASGITRIVEGLPDPKINCLLAGDDGGLWIGTDKGVAQWTGGGISTTGLPAALGGVSALAMIRDRDANVWIAAGPGGLLRVNGNGVATMAGRDRRSAAAVTAVLEDRDGNLWVGTTRGLERLRDGAFTTYASETGLPADGVGPIHADGAGRLWFAPSRGGLYWLRDGRLEHVTQAGLDDDVVYSIAGGGTDVWLGRQRGGVTRLRAQASGALAAETFTLADGLAQNSVYTVYQTPDGTLWAGTLSGGASRFKDGVFSTVMAPDGLGSNTVAAIIESADGTVWFGTPNGISTLSRGVWRRFSDTDGLPSNDINILFEDGAGRVWVGTASGPAVFAGGSFHVPDHLPAGLQGSILGFAEDATGALWIETAERLFRIRKGGADAGAIAVDAVREYGTADGLVTLEGVKRHRSLIADPRGRIWLARTEGLAMANPARDDGSERPALAVVEGVSADGAAVDLQGSGRVPAGRQRITIAYAGLSLGVPDRVKYRYRLDGFDRDWSPPVLEREAAYTNLGPGPYTFRVMASNGEGRWTGREALVRFEVEPRAWQTGWFRVTAVLLGVLVAWGGFRLRVFHLSRQLNRRFEERLAERTRIAQELHDTLLQGFVSASMQLHVAADRLPDESPVKASLGRVLDLMGRVIDEGRNAVRGLRAPSHAARDLELAFAGLREELAEADQTDYRVIVEGQARPLHPLVRDEVYRIGREALVNAFRHAKAQNVEIELDYTADHLRLHVRDDGRGVDPRVARAGSDGHWGIAGMRERAGKIGARITISSRGGAGTHVELTVPGQAAFVPGPSASSRTWLTRFLSRAWKAPDSSGMEDDA